MRVVLFCHSLLSDYDHGSAPFLRGVVAELERRGHEVRVYEPVDAWCVVALARDFGVDALDVVKEAYPSLAPSRYEPARLDLDQALDGADVVIVHAWNEAELVRRIGEHRKHGRSRYVLFFHDSHHRSVTDERAMDLLPLEGYDAVLAFGASVRDIYERRGWSRRTYIWHEAADVNVLHPRPVEEDDDGDGDLVWVGNWGDAERTAELRELVLEPACSLALAARIYGAHYPAPARALLREYGVVFGGFLPNVRLPAVFARFRATVHLPRRPYVDTLVGVPTMRVFEALACGIPLVTGTWHDVEGLFTPGSDYLVAKRGVEMRGHLTMLLEDPSARKALADHGRQTILARHTCAHRVDELLGFVQSLRAAT
ncbi:MAG: glycosyltransferase [Labilithrix sp.]|nr:glycosyltransferase [Labilithrix sp.]